VFSGSAALTGSGTGLSGSTSCIGIDLEPYYSGNYQEIVFEYFVKGRDFANLSLGNSDLRDDWILYTECSNQQIGLTT